MNATTPEIFILRHGQTEWNREKRAQGQMDSPLTDLGREQARAQNRLLKSAALPPDTTYYCSPLGRTRQTAELALAGLADDVILDARLMEVSVGEFEGQLLADCAARWPAVFDTGMWGEWCFLAPGGEGFHAFSQRLQSWLDELATPAVIVGHGMVSLILRGLVLGLDMEASLALPGGQGVVYHVKDGVHRRLGA